MSMSKFVSQADYWKDRAERAEAKLAGMERQPPIGYANGDALDHLLDDRVCVVLGSEDGFHRTPVFRRPTPSEDGFVTVTTTEYGRCVMVSRQDEDRRILSVIWEAKDVPTEPVNARLLEALSALLDDIEALIGESAGVYGLHLNGDVSPWSELEEGGRFERLSSMSRAREAISAAEAVPKEPVAELPVNARLLDVAVWPAGYCRDPNGKMSIPAGKEEDFNFGYDVGFQEAWEILNSAISAAGKSLTPQQERPSA